MRALRRDGPEAPEWDMDALQLQAARHIDMRKRAKIDGNQAEIVEALRTVGFKVLSLAPMGNGCPDLLVCRGYDLRLVEVKSDKGKLTEDQERFIVRDGWPVSIIRSVEDALNL